MRESDKNHGEAKVDIGCWVKVKEEGVEEEELFHIATVTRPHANQIAPDNAMGKALIGAVPGDEVTVEGPAGPIKFLVLDVGRKDDGER